MLASLPVTTWDPSGVTGDQYEPGLTWGGLGASLLCKEGLGGRSSELIWGRGTRQGALSPTLSLPLSSPFLGSSPSPFRVQLDNPGSSPQFKNLNLITPAKPLLPAKGTETQALGLGASLFGGHPAAPRAAHNSSCPLLPCAHPSSRSRAGCFPTLELGLALVCSDWQDAVAVTLPQSGAGLWQVIPCRVL